MSTEGMGLPGLIEHMKEAPPIFLWIWSITSVLTLVVVALCITHIINILKIGIKIREHRQETFIPFLADAYIKILLFFLLSSICSWSSLIFIRFVTLFQLLLHLYEAKCLSWFWHLMTYLFDGSENAYQIIHSISSHKKEIVQHTLKLFRNSDTGNLDLFLKDQQNTLSTPYRAFSIPSMSETRTVVSNFQNAEDHNLKSLKNDISNSKLESLTTSSSQACYQVNDSSSSTSQTDDILTLSLNDKASQKFNSDDFSKSDQSNSQNDQLNCSNHSLHHVMSTPKFFSKYETKKKLELNPSHSTSLTDIDPSTICIQGHLSQSSCFLLLSPTQLPTSKSRRAAISSFLDSIKFGNYQVYWPLCIPLGTYLCQKCPFTKRDMRLSYQFVNQYLIIAVLTVLSPAVSTQLEAIFQVISVISLMICMYGILILIRGVLRVFTLKELALEHKLVVIKIMVSIIKGSEIILRNIPMIRGYPAPYTAEVMSRVWTNVIINVSCLPIVVLAIKAYTPQDLFQHYFYNRLRLSYLAHFFTSCGPTQYA